MDGFRTILKFFMNRRTAIGYSVMALLTLGSERAFSLVAFRCPCSNENFKYGLVFLFSPAFVLLVFGYFLNNKTWKLFTGTELSKNILKQFWNKKRFSSTKGLFLLFSQILGWCVIVAMALFSLLTTCCASCQSKVSHLQLMFWKVYAEKEKEQLEQTFQLYATKLSERNLKCFFENRKPEVMPLPAFQAWEDASQLYAFSSSKQHYSTIHRLVEEGQKEVNEERETTYDFVDRREIP
uniref:Calcium homeostasis modulator family member 5 n=1 Tax=Pavo cristatus TaxID=9049 RepID=A0A8C9F0W9_PAVCR